MPRNTAPLEFNLILALSAAACGGEWDESATPLADTSAGVLARAGSGDAPDALPEAIDDSCATPQFVDGAGPGELVRCEGRLADSYFYFDQCKLTCGNPVKQSVEAVAFPGDEEVGACCEAGVSAEALVAGCKSDCAHGACLGALLRFDELLADPATTAPCGVLAGCKARVIESLTHYKNFVAANFAACVQAVVDDELFPLGEPPCGPFAGCLKSGSLELHCEISGVQQDVVLEPVCEQALNQPPAPAPADP
ncbi:hypothetical protein SAMN02745121_03403 [Nannocystis exedens]|uniref:Lipoprotein n=1 Tax=Nannocystis exedens TaxID=54 RepID=A0A1I1YMR2_9BACT|nr:hypothetical protein [Nannocystis exedens]PCC70269.1 hypothetical protein NAEX_03311 [Nannocystis exedens]SFE20816.1 hypothetical protein SAMN02745121_03403 [Nannocystis exedens]